MKILITILLVITIRINYIDNSIIIIIIIISINAIREILSHINLYFSLTINLSHEQPLTKVLE
jgi:hypothetical protein